MFPIDGEADPAEHFLIPDTLLTSKGVPDATGEGFIEGHHHSLQCS
jgi:hypothetical protein